MVAWEVGLSGSQTRVPQSLSSAMIPTHLMVTRPEELVLASLPPVPPPPPSLPTSMMCCVWGAKLSALSLGAEMILIVLLFSCKSRPAERERGYFMLKGFENH